MNRLLDGNVSTHMWFKYNERSDHGGYTDCFWVEFHTQNKVKINAYKLIKTKDVSIQTLIQKHGISLQKKIMMVLIRLSIAKQIMICQAVQEQRLCLI